MSQDYVNVFCIYRYNTNNGQKDKLESSSYWKDWCRKPQKTNNITGYKTYNKGCHSLLWTKIRRIGSKTQICSKHYKAVKIIKNSLLDIRWMKYKKYGVATTDKSYTTIKNWSGAQVLVCVCVCARACFKRKIEYTV